MIKEGTMHQKLKDPAEVAVFWWRQAYFKYIYLKQESEKKVPYRKLQKNRKWS